MKIFPEIGAHLNLVQRTGNYWIDICKKPCVVIAKDGRSITVRRCKEFYTGPQYYDYRIEENENGRTYTMHWSEKHKWWQYTHGSGDRYPYIAKFEEWEYVPYMN